MIRCYAMIVIGLLLLTTEGLAAGKLIVVNQFVEHPALDAVYQGMVDYFQEKGEDVRCKRFIAQANRATVTQIAQQMLGERADLLVAIATPSAQACAQVLLKAPPPQQRPLLFTGVTDPVAAGLVKDLHHPGGNITGVSDLLPVGDHIAMVFSFKPDIKRLGLLYNSGEANSLVTVKAIRTLSASKSFQLVEATAAKTGDVFQAAASLVGKVDAIFIPTDNTIISALENVLKVGIDNKIPVFAADVDSVKRGAVAAMGFDYYKHGRQTGAMAEKILKGADPGSIPIEFQTALQLHINTKSAAAMGIIPPQALLEQAAKIYP